MKNGTSCKMAALSLICFICELFEAVKLTYVPVYKRKTAPNFITLPFYEGGFHKKYALLSLIQLRV